MTLALAAILLARLGDAPVGGGCISPVSLDPTMGQGDVADFVAVYRHCDDATMFRVVQLWIGEEPTPAGARVNLGYEAGMFTLEDGGSCMPGEPEKRSDWCGDSSRCPARLLIFPTAAGRCRHRLKRCSRHWRERIQIFTR